MFSVQILKDILFELSLPSRLWIAYSGGLDSHVLLHSLVQLREDNPELQLRAIHINHGLNLNASKWGEHCVRVCDALDVPCVVKNVDPNIYAEQTNLEEIARNQRYQIFSTILEEKDCVLTAHHLDDQAETLLLRLLRGAGLEGLSAMVPKRSLARGILIRPLLDISRASLVAYAKRENLIWIEDESNSDTRFNRNYLRHEIMPLLQARWPGAHKVFSRTALLCRETHELLDEVLTQDLTTVVGSVVNTLSVPALKKLSNTRQKTLLRLWLKQLNLPLPNSKKLEQLQQDCLNSKEDATPVVRWGEVEVCRFNHNLYAMPALLPHDAKVIIPWDMQKPLVLPAKIGILTANINASSGIFIPEGEIVSIRFRQTGERFHPLGRQGSHPLKKLWQEWKVPPWCRDRIPLLYIGDHLAMVVGFAIAQEYGMPSHRRGKMVLVEFCPGCMP